MQSLLLSSNSLETAFSIPIDFIPYLVLIIRHWAPIVEKLSVPPF